MVVEAWRNTWREMRMLFDWRSKRLWRTEEETRSRCCNDKFLFLFLFAWSSFWKEFLMTVFCYQTDRLMGAQWDRKSGYGPAMHRMRMTIN